MYGASGDGITVSDAEWDGCGEVGTHGGGVRYARALRDESLIDGSSIASHLYFVKQFQLFYPVAKARFFIFTL